VTLQGIGTVDASGSRTVNPSSSTTYVAVAKGPGGTQEASARVTVNQPPATAAAAGPSEEELFARSVKDLYFDYDKYNIRPADAPSADGDARFFLDHPNVKVLIEGHCDDRGSEEYNLALGDSRATSMKEALLKAGVEAERIKTISYGKEKPFCSSDDEPCWQQNRRAHLVFQK
ncbi:MAG TPA: peptidoglycan-associated lipoprotein Pal, partial [Terriglobales bacterium]|nr:peptidoglycan-associated lipoprotein Pal [Terriglobales bacterium]